jgi:hypothetical protein
VQILPPAKNLPQNLEIQFKHLYREGNYDQKYGDKPAYLLSLDLLLRCVERGVDNDQGAIPNKKLLKVDSDNDGGSQGLAQVGPSSSKKKRTKW